MKTTILILTTLLTLNISLIFAHNPKFNIIKVEPVKIEITIELGTLIPEMPIMAEFSDGIEHMAFPAAMVKRLSPITPKVADFEDDNSASTIDVEKLAPVTPKESDFEDTNFLNPVVLDILAPTTPAEADFIM